MHALTAYISLLRVPIFFLLAGLAIPICAFHIKSTRPLLRGTFDVNLPSIPTVLVASCVYSWIVALCAITILEGAPERMGSLRLEGWWVQRITLPLLAWRNVPLKHVWLVIVAICMLPTVLCFLKLITGQRESRAKRAFACVLTASFIPLSFAVPPMYWGYQPSAKFFAILFRLDPRGYLHGPPGQEVLGRFHVYSSSAVLIVFVQLAIYLGIVLICIWRKRRVPKWLLRWDGFPVLYSVYSMLGLLCLLLSALSFFLDRHGISLILVLLLWRLLMSRFDSGSTVGFWKPVSPMPTPREVLEANSAETGGRVIIACASGGGIHAAAWTTKVLTGLDELYPDNFAVMLRALSAVSGGSVGVMNYAGAYGPYTGQVVPELCKYANTLSRMSSLPAAIGGWFLFDLPRLFCPWLPSWLTRGWALERRWDLDGYYNWPLSLWGVQAWLGRRPAVLFNCTAVETGRAVVFGSSTLASRNGQHGLSFHELTHGQADVMIPTAARLSATFPFVSPASRIHRAANVFPDLSYVDGGYYDNFGVSTALEFLDQALSEEQPPPDRNLPKELRETLSRLSAPVPIREVLLIEIRAAATPETKPGRVLFEQLRAPARAILAVRSAAQRLRNDSEVRLSREVLARRGVTLRNVIFEYPDSSIPLSWHLAHDEQDQIDGAWLNGCFASQKQVVAEFCKDPVHLPLPDLHIAEGAAARS